MRILVFGGNGFVGLNIAVALLARGHAVTLFDRVGLPLAAERGFSCYADRLTAIQGDVTDRPLVEEVIAAGYETIILGAAVTAGPERDAADPETILRVNLLAQTPILTAARRGAAASGASSIFRPPRLTVRAHSGTCRSMKRRLCDPVSLYAITKFASEKVAARLAALWQCEIISVRLSAVFGPWERTNDVRDTPSPQAQILAAMQGGREAILPRPGVRDWIYAVDVAEAVTLLVEAERPKHHLYNISTGVEWSALQWGQELAALHPGYICRLAEAGEAPTVDLHSPADRAPLSVLRLAQEFGWRARFGCADSAADLSVWWREHRGET